MFYVYSVTTFHRYDENKRKMDPGFPRSFPLDLLSIVRKIDAAFELEGKIQSCMSLNPAACWSMHSYEHVFNLR